MCLFACFAKVAVCAAVLPAVSNRCFTSLFLHLHPLPTHLPQKRTDSGLIQFLFCPAPDSLFLFKYVWNHTLQVDSKDSHLRRFKGEEWICIWLPFCSKSGCETYFTLIRFSFLRGEQTHKSTEVPIRSVSPNPNFQSGLWIKDEFLMEKMSCLLASTHLQLIYASASALLVKAETLCA